MIEVQGVLQFFAIWQDELDYPADVPTCTRLSYLEAFHLTIRPTPKEFVASKAATYQTLLCFTDSPSKPFRFRGTRDNRLLAHQDGSNEQFEIFLLVCFWTATAKKFKDFQIQAPFRSADMVSIFETL
ncbi:unnamed protein product [Gongylonema pulchrum]|uniref:Uncharacterized protein n=1 Tax=Gongylonema pulchrum TaxID=637853 RepID=A0A183DBP8_9BILA|nr:unnamed protein product [Gongylonema pulchrum]